MPMQIVCVPNRPPQAFKKSLFLAGPSPRDPSHPNWRIEALKILEELGYDGVVFVPLPETGNWPAVYDDQVEWEKRHLDMADTIAFWVPRDMEKLPALTTNVEFGMYYSSGKVVLGYPESAPHMRYLATHAMNEKIPVFHDPRESLKAAVLRIGQGAERTGGERMIPLHIWKTPHFQNWLIAQKSAGNRLDDARMLWTFRVGPNKSFSFAFAIHVNVYVASEQRNKTNEFILARPDSASIIAYRKRPVLQDSEVVLIREFRSTASTSDGFIREAPGGSSFKPNQDVYITAANELREETGFTVEPSRLRKIGARQLCGTFSVHQAHVFACELTEEELEALRADQVPHGNTSESERTYVEVHRIGDLLNPGSNAVDWSMIGMIMTALQ